MTFDVGSNKRHMRVCVFKCTNLVCNKRALIMNKSDPVLEPFGLNFEL